MMYLYVNIFKLLLFLVLFLFVWRFAKEEVVRFVQGWPYILGGIFCCLIAISIGVFSAAFAAGGREPPGGSFVWAVFSNGVFFPAGFVLIVVGINKILPNITGLRRTERELRSLAAALEGRVADRTIELRTANELLVKEINERKAAEHSARESEEKYRTLVDNAMESLIVVQDGVIKYINRRSALLTNRSEEDVLARPFLDYVYPEDRETLIRRYMSLMAGQTTPERRICRLLTVSNDTVWVELESIVIQWNDKPALLVFAADITEQKKAEAALRLVLARLNAVLDALPDAVCLKDLEGKFLFMNKAFEEFISARREDAVGSTLEDFNLPEQLKRKLVEYDAHAVQCREPFLRESTYSSGKRTHHLEIMTFPVFDESQTMLGTGRILRDVTERKLLDKQIRTSHKMDALGRLAGGISHDFNNLLQVISGYSELLLLKTSGQNKLRGDIQNIIKAASMGKNLVKRLPAFSRSVQTPLEPLKLNDLIGEMEELLTRTIPKMIAVHLELDKGTACIKADPTQIEQVLLNLVINARDAMQDEGELSISTTNVVLDEDYCKTQIAATPGSYVALTVRDSGSGIPDDVIGHIFDPFFTTKSVGEGTGLGLATAYGIMMQHGGFITCDTEMNLGTIFTLYFPAISAPDTMIQLKIAGKSDHSGTETILIIDDDESVRSLTREILDREGYNTLIATDGPEGIEIFQEHTGAIDLVLLDYIMPKMSGKQCLSYLIALDAAVKVIMATGHLPEGSTEEMLSLGAKGLLSKPFSAEELFRMVRQTLDEKPQVEPRKIRATNEVK